MVFTTIQFVVFFAIVFFAYYALPSRFRWWLLLGASCFFYAYATPYYLIFLGLTTVVTYFVAIGIDNNLERQKGWLSANGKVASREEKRAYKAVMERRRKHMVTVSVILLIGMLVVFKYLDFLFKNIGWIGGALGLDFSLSPLHLILPIGLSFYVFQSLGYCIDVSREMVPAERNFFRHALFVSYFPQILQGPIGDYCRLAPQLFAERKFNYEHAVFGLQRIVWGFFKKVMIANIIADWIDPVWTSAGNYTGFLFWGAILFLYSIQLYADFSGYMDIACGCSQMLGIKLDENFNCPYFSKSIAEFWRNWHITLGTWFKNYLFYPLLRSEMLTNLRKKLKGHEQLSNSLPTIIALLVVWLLIGLWHGADWSYVLYGLFHGSFIMAAIALTPLTDRFHRACPKLVANKWYCLFQILRTFLIVMIGYAIFKPANLSTTFEILRQSLNGLGLDSVSRLLHMLYSDFWRVLMAMVLMFAVDVVHYSHSNGTIRSVVRHLPCVLRWGIYVFVIWLMVFYGLYGAKYQQFEYFKF